MSPSACTCAWRAAQSRLNDLEVPAGTGQVSLLISLDGHRVEMKFTGKHAIDLKAAVSAAGESRDESES